MIDFFTILAMIVSLSIVVIIHEGGHFLGAKFFKVYVEEFGIGFPPRLIGKKIKETIYSLNWFPFGGFVKIYGLDHSGEHSNFGIERSFSHQNIFKRIAIIIAGILINFIAAWLLISIVFSVGAPQSVLITDVVKNGLADKAGILKNDQFVDFKSIKDFISFIEANKGKEISLDVKRDKEQLSVKIKPRVSVPEGEGNLGVLLVDIGTPKLGLFQSIWEGLKTTIYNTGMIFAGLGKLFLMIFKGENVINNFIGPVGIVNMAFETSKLGFVYFLNIFSLISLNLAVLNLIPFPGLDGTWLVFFILEKIRGKAVKARTMLLVNNLGFLFLVFLSLVIMAKDVMNLF